MTLQPNYRPDKSRVAIGFIVLALMSLLWAGTATAACSNPYTVQSGDTLRTIATRCGVTLASLEQANPQIADPSLIFPGQQISIPEGAIIPITGQQAALVISPTDGQPGTSVELAGSAFPPNSPLNVAIAEAANPPVYFNMVTTDQSGSFSLTLAMPTTLPVSGTWLIRASSATAGGPSTSANFQVTMPSPASAYTIQSGDTLSSIAGRFGTTVSALVAANPQVTNPDLIFAGTLLNIPGSGLIPITGQQAQLTLAPASGGPSTLVTVSGSDFTANASLSVKAGAQGSTPTVSVGVTTDGNGGFTTQLVIPPATPGGSVWLITAASSASGGPSATATFQVTLAAPAGLYTIQPGDTLVDLAVRFNTSIFGLLRANPNITDPGQLTVGQQIYMPGSTAVVNGQKIYIVKSGDTLFSIAMAQNVTLAVLEQANPHITDPGLIFAGDHVTLP